MRLKVKKKKKSPKTPNYLFTLGGISRSSALPAPETTWADATAGPAGRRPRDRPWSSTAGLGMPPQQCQPRSSSHRPLLKQQLAPCLSFDWMGRNLAPRDQSSGAWSCSCMSPERAAAAVCSPRLQLDESLTEPPTSAWHPAHHHSPPPANTEGNSALLKGCSLLPCGRKSLF